MKSKKGFTLVELMVVVVIVALLAALLIPMLTLRIEAARWAEGKAGAGTIATALRAYIVEVAELEPDVDVTDITIEMFMNPADLNGKYFERDNYELVSDDIVYTPNATGTAYVVEYTINITPGSMQETLGYDATQWTKGGYTLDHKGGWTEIP